MKSTLLVATFFALMTTSGCGTMRSGTMATSTTPPTSTAAPATNQSKEQLAAQGNLAIQQGNQMKDSAMKMSNGEMLSGLSKNELIMKADKLIADGNALKQRAMKM